LVSVGTDGTNDLVLTDTSVSRFHVELERRGDQILLVDPGSTNGVMMGGIRVERAFIPPGTQLVLGLTTVRIDDGEPMTIRLHDGERLGGIVGATEVMRKLMARVAQAARSDVAVLILGETGTGKELVAQAIRDASSRASKPFETVDCGALHPTLVASELFGHERGAFTGADQRHVGAFERADGGTIFLDEIGELPLALQASLLGVLERRVFRRLGGQQQVSTDVRVIAATNRDLRAEVNAKNFRQDLYFRLAVTTLRVPPLRERADDIPILVQHFLGQAGIDSPADEAIPGLDLESLRAHRWPGNVRELKNYVGDALAIGSPQPLEEESGALDEAPIPDDRPASGALKPLPFSEARAVAIKEFEKRYLKLILERSRDNVSRAAREAKVTRSYMNALLKRHGLR
jgi:DNA-binding NtrC family response regulator